MNKDDNRTTKQAPTLVGDNNNRALVGLKTGLETVFPDPKTRPSFRTFCEWRARRYFPIMKVGKRVFVDPIQVRTALEKRFTIEAID